MVCSSDLKSNEQAGRGGRRKPAALPSAGAHSAETAAAGFCGSRAPQYAARRCVWVQREPVSPNHSLGAAPHKKALEWWFPFSFCFFALSCWFWRGRGWGGGGW